MFRKFFGSFGKRFYSTTQSESVLKQEKNLLDYMTTPKLIPFGTALGIYSVYATPYESKTIYRYVEAGICGGLAGWIFPVFALCIGTHTIANELGCRDQDNNSNKQIKNSSKDAGV